MSYLARISFVLETLVESFELPGSDIPEVSIRLSKYVDLDILKLRLFGLAVKGNLKILSDLFSDNQPLETNFLKPLPGQKRVFWLCFGLLTGACR